MSNFGFVHLTFSKLQELRFSHLVSGIDEDSSPDGGEAAISTAISGYTEWVTQAQPVVTLGWDWQMLFEGTAVRLVRVSPPNSNVMLENAVNVELPHDKADLLLGTFVDSFDWQSATLQYLDERYGFAKA